MNTCLKILTECCTTLIFQTKKSAIDLLVKGWNIKGFHNKIHLLFGFKASVKTLFFIYDCFKSQWKLTRNVVLAPVPRIYIQIHQSRPDNHAWNNKKKMKIKNKTKLFEFNIQLNLSVVTKEKWCSKLWIYIKKDWSICI